MAEFVQQTERSPAPSTSIDPAIYGGKPATLSDVPPAAAPANYTPPARDGLPAELTPADAQATAARADLVQQAGTTAWDSAKAAVQNWDTVKAWHAITEQRFAADPTFNAATWYKNVVPTAVPLEVERWLLKSQSVEEANQRLDDYQTEQKNERIASANPGVSVPLRLLDPVYIGIDAASMGLGGVLQAGRLATGIASAVGAGAVDALANPTATQGQILATALMQGAGTAAFFKPGKPLSAAPMLSEVDDEAARAGKIVSTDPDFPAGELQKSAAGSRPLATAESADHMPQTPLDEVPGEPAAEPSMRTPYTQVDSGPQVLGRTPAEAAEAAQARAESSAAADNLPQPMRGLPTQSGGAIRTEPGVGLVDRIVQQYGDVTTKALWQHLKDAAGPILDRVQGLEAKTPADIPKGLEILGTDKAAAIYVVGDGFHHVVLGPNVSKFGPTFRAAAAVHEMAHAATVIKINYGLKNPATATGKLVADLESLRVQAARAAKEAGYETADHARYLTKDVKEFVAGIYTPTARSFREVLSKLPDPDPAGYKSLLSKGVDIIRKLFGFDPQETNALLRTMDLTDKLLGLPILKNSIEKGSTAALEVEKRVDSIGKRVGDTITWNLHKTLAKFSDTAKRVADMLVDDPVDMRGNSVISQQEAIRRDLLPHLIDYESQLTSAMSEQGAGLLQRITRAQAAQQVQQNIEREVAAEMLRRDEMRRTGADLATGPQPAAHIKKMADTLDKLYSDALNEAQRSGVKGAESVAAQSGYFSRHWQASKIESVLGRLQRTGTAADRKEAVSMLKEWAYRSVQNANPTWESTLAHDVSGAIIDRALRKGEFSDSAFRAHIGNESLAEVRDILESSGVRADRLQRAMDVLAGQVDEAGKTSSLKHRISMDSQVPLKMNDGSNASLIDMIDTNLTNLSDKYMQTMSGQSALARKGLYGPKEIGDLRTEMVNSIPDARDKQQAVKLFDNIMNQVHGQPVGDDLPDAWRKMQAVTQMVGLAASGLWQVTEYATAMGHYGLVKTFGYCFANMPGFRSLVHSTAINPSEATSLKNVLAHGSWGDIRMRPFVQRLEDNFDWKVSDSVGLGLMQAKQLVPYLNAMKFVHHHQAQMVANLVVDAFQRAVSGEPKYAAMLERYGATSQVIQAVKDDVTKFGMDTAKWSDKGWDAIRGPLYKMMDESVLRSRTGEIPAFAQFSQIGKFVFTFQSFVLGAHNKILAGTMGRQGLMGAALIAGYQFPLTMLGTLANNTIQGTKPPSGDSWTFKQLAAQSISQMGIMGLFGDLGGAILGNKQQFGAPGLMAIDRGMALINHTANAKWGAAGNDLLTNMPLLSLVPGIRAWGNSMKASDTSTKQN